VDNPFKSPAILSLCTGMRGLERGIERAIGPVRTVSYVEIEAVVIENLVQQMEQGVLAPTPIFSNVKTFPWELFRGKVHGITGGYPCQPFSAAGLRKGADDPRHLWPFIKYGVKKSRPDWVFFENVEGHLSLGFERVQKDLRKMGYVVEAGVFTAQEVGAPHKRSRLFILGVENTVLIRMRRGNDIGIAKRTEGRFEIQTERSSHMANPNTGERTRPGEAEGESQTIESKEQWQERDEVLRERMRTQSGDQGSGTELAYRISERLEGHTRDEQGERRERTRTDRSITNSSVSLWPSGPTREQYEWEAPRVESSVGYAINGYNFREDLLRMAGNGVVEQTAELAFRTLLKKHGI